MLAQWRAHASVKKADAPLTLLFGLASARSATGSDAVSWLHIQQRSIQPVGACCCLCLRGHLQIHHHQIPAAAPQPVINR